MLGLTMLLMLVNQAWAQSRTVSGKVTAAEDGTPLPGVTVLVQGTTVGTATGVDGSYTINVPAGNNTLAFSFIGYTTETRSVDNASTVNVSLKVDAKQLEEVIVSAIGVKEEKRTIGYAAQNVNVSEIKESREPNLVNALAGKVAGVNINNSGGQAGSSSRIVIRGTTSLTGDNQPLFVVDGIPIDNSTNRGYTGESTLFNGTGSNRAIDIDPNLIENVTVLKGASATALWGSRGANGVIVITTKRGKDLKDRKYPRVNLSTSVAFDDVVLEGFQDKYLSGSLGLFKNELPYGAGGFSEDTRTAATQRATQTSLSWGPHRDSVSQFVIDSIGMPKIFNPRSDFYQTGKVWNRSVSVSGGGDKSTYVFTYSNLNQEGIVPNNTYNRNSLTAAFTSQLSSKFSVNTSVNYIKSDNQRLPEGNGQRSYLFGLNFTPINFDINRYYTEPGNKNVTYTATAYNNPFWLAENNGNFSNTNRFIVSNSAELTILPWLKLSDRVGIDTYTDEQAEHVNIGTRSVPKGRMYESLIKNTQINNDLLLTANYDFNEDLNLSALIGHNTNVRTYNSRTVRGLDLSIPGFFDITNAQTTQAYQGDLKTRLIGVYGSATLDYKNYLFLTATGRNDWSSTLPVENNSYFYPSIAAGFVFTDLLGLSNSNYFPYGKLRLSWAQAGNSASAYQTQQTFTQAAPGDGTRGTIIFPFQGLNGFEVSGQLNSNTLVHELVTEKEVGLDLRFFQNRLGIDAAYYNKVSNDQIISQEVAASSGYTNRVTNAGEILNKGIEVSVTATPLKIGDFNWDMLVNFGRNKYKLVSLAENVDNIFLGGFTSPQIRADKDYGYGVIWGAKLKRNDAGKVIVDEEGYPEVADALGPIGNATPDWTGSLRNTFTYKGISLSGLIDVRHGGDIMNMDLYYMSYYGTAKITEQRGTYKTFDGVKEDGTPNDIPVLQDQAYFQNYFSNVDEFFVEDGSFVKLREITLAYSLPKALINRIKLQDVTLSATGRNLWINSDFTYRDPEGSLLGNGNAQGFYHAVTPSTKGYTFGVNIAF